MSEPKNSVTNLSEQISIQLKKLKDQLQDLMATSANLIERNSLIDSGCRFDSSVLPKEPKIRFEILLEDFLNNSQNIELNLRTLQEYIQQGRASIQNLPVIVSGIKCEFAENRLDPIESNSHVSYNQYLSAIKFQVDTAKAVKAIISEFVTQQQNLNKIRQSN